MPFFIISMTCQIKTLLVPSFTQFFLFVTFSSSWPIYQPGTKPQTLTFLTLLWHWHVGQLSIWGYVARHLIDCTWLIFRWNCRTHGLTFVSESILDLALIKERKKIIHYFVNRTQKRAQEDGKKYKPKARKNILSENNLILMLLCFWSLLLRVWAILISIFLVNVRCETSQN